MIEPRPAVACWLCRARFDEHCVDIRGNLFGRRENPHPKEPPIYGEHLIRKLRRMWWHRGLWLATVRAKLGAGR